MIYTKRALIFTLIFPIVALIILTGYKHYIISNGVEVTLPISGYDPRDLLSGHYLIYQVDYGVEGICSSKSLIQTGYVCLEPKMFSYNFPQDCNKLITGICQYGGRFVAGIEKFYIPEGKAKFLEQQVLSKSASIVLSITSSGHAQVKDLLINGISWKKLIP